MNQITPEAATFRLVASMTAIVLNLGAEVNIRTFRFPNPGMKGVTFKVVQRTMVVIPNDGTFYAKVKDDCDSLVFEAAEGTAAWKALEKALLRGNVPHSTEQVL
jgi:hypothetical protein